MAPRCIADTADVLDVSNEYTESAPKADNSRYVIPDTYLGEQRPIKVLVIGFGAAGINLVHKLGQTQGQRINIQCYEKNPEVGGTWYENRFVQIMMSLPGKIMQN